MGNLKRHCLFLISFLPYHRLACFIYPLASFSFELIESSFLSLRVCMSLIVVSKLQGVPNQTDHCNSTSCSIPSVSFQAWNLTCSFSPGIPFCLNSPCASPPPRASAKDLGASDRWKLNSPPPIDLPIFPSKFPPCGRTSFSQPQFGGEMRRSCLNNAIMHASSSDMASQLGQRS